MSKIDQYEKEEHARLIEFLKSVEKSNEKLVAEVRFRIIFRILLIFFFCVKKSKKIINFQIFLFEIEKQTNEYTTIGRDDRRIRDLLLPRKGSQARDGPRRSRSIHKEDS